MQYYEYKTRGVADGKIYKGIITADNIETAEKELKEIAKTSNKVLVDLMEIQEAK